MKKVLIGCLAVFVLLFAAGAGAAYVFLWRPAQQVVQSVRQFQQIGELDRRVRARAAYDAPADGVLSDGQLRRYLQVQRDMHAELESGYGALRARIEAIDARGNPTPAELLRAYRDIADLVLAAKRAQVDALNRHGFSLAEYGWVRARTLEALGYATYASFDLRELVEAAGDDIAAAPSTGVSVPPENAALVAPFRQELEARIGFALVGL